MANLLKETDAVLAENGKTFDDLIAVTGHDFQFPVSVFRTLADTDYDSGYGAPEVAEDMVLIGDGFWLERHEYDGSEWWEYKEMPQYQNLPVRTPKALTVRQANKNGEDVSCGWETLSNLNKKVFSNEQG